MTDYAIINFSNSSTVSLFTLLPTFPFLLLYALPLLCFSLLLTCVGTFLTLDRTRSFVSLSVQKSTSSALPSRWMKSMSHLFRSGLGGWVIGYAFAGMFIVSSRYQYQLKFAVYTTFFLTTMIPSVMPSAPMNSRSFLVTWLFSSCLCALLAGRYQFITFGLAGITEMATFSIALSIICHPPVLARQILAAISISLGILNYFFLHISKLSHVSLQIVVSLTGAFGIAHSLALLAHIGSWSDPWHYLWLPHDIMWGSYLEKILDVIYCILIVFEVFCDWMLYKRFGENPDKSWDNYLISYSQDPTYVQGRSGLYTSLSSPWNYIKRVWRYTQSEYLYLHKIKSINRTIFSVETQNTSQQ